MPLKKLAQLTAAVGKVTLVKSGKDEKREKLKALLIEVQFDRSKLAKLGGSPKSPELNEYPIL